MIDVSNVEVFNFDGALRGMRNPLNSWDKSDSSWDETRTVYNVGRSDLSLMNRLYKAGSEHRKYLRQIFISMDIVAPVFWWAELDTYKVNVTRNSCSFMHKGTSKPFTISDFSTNGMPEEFLESVVKNLNFLRDEYLTTNNPEVFEQIRCLLPSGYNQRSTITMNYENAVNMINQRSNHRLSEWREFCEVLRKLPYMEEIMREDRNG